MRERREPREGLEAQCSTVAIRPEEQEGNGTDDNDGEREGRMAMKTQHPIISLSFPSSSASPSPSSLPPPSPSSGRSESRKSDSDHDALVETSQHNEGTATKTCRGRKIRRHEGGGSRRSTRGKRRKTRPQRMKGRGGEQDHYTKRIEEEIVSNTHLYRRPVCLDVWRAPMGGEDVDDRRHS
jgi:hypothetical protein